MAKQIEINGYGSCIPPEKAHVIIYFIEKNRSEEDAIKFYYQYALRKWKNLKGKAIKDWKMHAWHWMWHKNQFKMLSK